MDQHMDRYFDLTSSYQNQINRSNANTNQLIEQHNKFKNTTISNLKIIKDAVELHIDITKNRDAELAILEEKLNTKIDSLNNTLEQQQELIGTLLDKISNNTHAKNIFESLFA